MPHDRTRKDDENSRFSHRLVPEVDAKVERRLLYDIKYMWMMSHPQMLLYGSSDRTECTFKEKGLSEY